MSLAVVQWNLGNFDVALRPGGTGPDGMSYSHARASLESDLPSFAGVIAAERPDLVFLQEVDVEARHHELIADRAGLRVLAAGAPENGRAPALLAAAGVERLGPLEPPSSCPRAVGARVRAGGLEWDALSWHSDAGIRTASRAAQHRALAAWSARRPRLLVGGDFNFDDAPSSLHATLEALRRLPLVPAVVSSDWAADSAALDALKAALTDAGASAGPTAGAPRLWTRIFLPWAAPLIPVGWALGAGRGRSRLDYVFTAGAKPLRAVVRRVSGPGAAGHPAAEPGAFPWLDHDPLVVAVEPI